MSGIRLHMSNRLETLMDALAEVLREPLSHPLAREIVVVQSRGMETWINTELAKRHGIAANISYPYPVAFVRGILLPDEGEAQGSPYDPPSLAWRIMALLPPLLGEPAFAEVQAYLDRKTSDIKTYQFAWRMADLFDLYLLFRPDMVARWEEGRDDHWQAVLWRRIVAAWGPRHRLALYESWRRLAVKPPLPERVSFFGVSALPPFHLSFLRDLGSEIDVHLFIVNPSRHYWGDILPASDIARRVYGSPGAAAPEDLHYTEGNRLLASLGKVGREFLDHLYQLPLGEENQVFVTPAEDTILGALQADILDLRDRAAPAGEERGADDSLRVAVCHGALREVEVLHDFILHRLARDPDLKPGDFLVAAPDMGPYAPLVEAVFSRPPGDPRRIPYAVVGGTNARTSPVLNAFFRILDLTGGRREAPAVLDILASPPVRSRFDLGEEDLETIVSWVRETAVRWGIDGEDKKRHDLPPVEENTWRAGIERMLMGYAMSPEDDGTLCLGILPFTGIEGERGDLLGRFLTFVKDLFAVVADLEGKRDLASWSDLFLGILETFFRADGEGDHDLRSLRRAVEDLGSLKEKAAYGGEVDLATVRAHLRNTLEGTGGGGLAVGGVTFASLLDVRGIPFRVVCLLGMNFDDFPRRSPPLDFDLRAHDPRPGDRARRDDDRYLFLEALLSARRTLYISYVGRDIKDNSPIPPSVVVSDLLDAVEESFGAAAREGIVTVHPLQAFDPAYFTGEGPLFSYAEENCRAARRLTEPAGGEAPVPLAVTPAQDPLPVEATPEDLFRFFAHPVRYFLNRRLGVFLEDEETPEDEETFAPDTLGRYLLLEEVLRAVLEGKGREETGRLLRARGSLPHGAPGDAYLCLLHKEASALARRIRRYTRGEAPLTREIDLTVGGFHLVGRIEGIHEGALVRWKGARRSARHLLEGWIAHLLVNLAEGGLGRATVLVLKDGDHRFRPCPAARDVLEGLLEVFREGHARALPLFPRTSLRYAQLRQQGLEESTALLKARDAEWNHYRHPEAEDAYLSLCFGTFDPFGPDFGRLAEAVFLPLLEHGE